jgi:hypothetical protein
MNKPIINYRQMKLIFDHPAVVNWKKAYCTSKLIAAIDHLADNKADGTTFARMTPAGLGCGCISTMFSSSVLCCCYVCFAGLIFIPLARNC